MKYLIHAVPERMWYVEGYMIPSLKKQGIKKRDILVFCDDGHFGNLGAWLESLKLVRQYKGDMWHLQDDVLISGSFLERSQQDGDVVCGFCSEYDDFPYAGEMEFIPVEKMWYSFPCIRYKCEYADEFMEWYEREGKILFADWVQLNMCDDSFFKEFLLRNHPDAKVKCISPCLVQHVDYLIGGSLVNKVRIKNAQGIFWNEHETLADLKQWLIKEGRL